MGSPAAPPTATGQHLGWLVLGLLLLVGCNATGDTADDEQVDMPPPGEFPASQPTDGIEPFEQADRLDEPPSLAAPDTADGEALYGANCAVCHQADGSGAGDGAIPALAGNPLVTAVEIDPVIHVVIDGRGGMPSFDDDLEDEEIAEVVSYLRQLGDNDSSPVTTGDDEEARDAERFTGEPGAADEDD